MNNVQTEFQNLVVQLEDEIIKPFVKQREFVYIDSDLLYDYRLGAVFARIKNASDYEYVQQCIPAYLDAPGLECAKFFPKLNLTEDMLDKTIENPKNFTFLTAASPATNFIRDFQMMIRVINDMNKSKESQRPIRITINQRKFEMHHLYKKNLVGMIQSIDPRITVEFTNYKSWFEVPELFLMKQDFICVYDLVEFLQVGTASQKLMKQVPSKLLGSCVVALWNATMKDPTISHVSEFKSIMEIMVDKFTFINKSIIKKEADNG